MTNRFTGKATQLTLVGIWQPRDPTDPYWRLYPDVEAGVGAQTATYGPFVLSREDFAGGYLANSSASWLAEIDLTPMVHTGTQFVPQTAASVVLPREGDVIISPSAKLLVSRVSGTNGSQSGFIMRKLVATKNGSTYSVNTSEIARYCLRGGKPAISFDEKWMVFHHYVEANDWAALGSALLSLAVLGVVLQSVTLWAFNRLAR